MTAGPSRPSAAPSSGSRCPSPRQSRAAPRDEQSQQRLERRARVKCAAAHFTRALVEPQAASALRERLLGARARSKSPAVWLASVGPNCPTLVHVTWTTLLARPENDPGRRAPVAGVSAHAHHGRSSWVDETSGREGAWGPGWWATSKTSPRGESGQQGAPGNDECTWRARLRTPHAL